MKITKNLNEAIISAFFFRDPKLVYLGCADDDMYRMHMKGEYKLLPDSQYIGIEDDNGKLIAVVRYEFFTAQCVSMHTFMSSELHSSSAPAESIQLLKDFIKNDLKINKVILIVPSTCKHIHKYAAKHGFVKEGCITNSYKWRQQMVDLVFYGMEII